MDAMRRIRDRIIQADRLKTIEVLRQNREAHLVAYEQAVANFPKAIFGSIVAFRDAVNGVDANDPDAQAKMDKVIYAYERPQKPQNFAKEYTRLIQTLEADTQETIELTGADVACFLHDEWDWKGGFEASIATISKYVGH